MECLGGGVDGKEGEWTEIGGVGEEIGSEILELER